MAKKNVVRKCTQHKFSIALIEMLFTSHISFCDKKRHLYLIDS